MAESTITEVQQLIQEGRAAAAAGDNIAARASFRRATELDPSSAEAWLELSGVVPVLSEKRGYIERALSLAPDNVDALARLQDVERWQAQGLQLAPGQRRPAPVVAAPSPVAPAAAAVEQALYCYNHPDRETGLLCVQCGRPICASCARPAAVGQLCPECRKERTPPNYQVGGREILLVGGATLLATGLLGGLLALLNFGGFFFSIFLGLFAGEIIYRVAERVSHAKRGRRMQLTVGIATALGVLLGAQVARIIALAGNIAGTYGVSLLEALPLALQFSGLMITIPMLIFSAAALVTASARLR